MSRFELVIAGMLAIWALSLVLGVAMFFGAVAADLWRQHREREENRRFHAEVDELNRELARR